MASRVASRVASLALACLAACAGKTAPPDDAASASTTSPATDGAPDPESRPDAKTTADRAAADRGGKADVKQAVDYPPVKCSDNLLFCDDFEGGLDPARWATMGSGVTISVDTTRAARGNNSIRVKKPQNPAAAGWIQSLKTFPLAAGKLNFRFYMYMEKLTPNRWFSVAFVTDTSLKADWPTPYAPHGFRLSFLPGSETDPAPSGFQTAWDNQIFAFAKANELVPVDRWVCWEFEYMGRDKLTIYRDGVEVPSAALKPGSDAVPNANLGFGLSVSHDDIFKHTDGFNVWYDEIAVSATNIGCTL